MAQSRAELDTIVAAAVAHNDSVVTPGADKRIERRRRIFVRRVGLADLDRTPLPRSEADIAVSAEKGPVYSVGQFGIVLSVAGRHRNVDAGFKLVDEVKVVHGEALETTDAQIRNVGRDVRHPAEISDRRRTVGGNWARLCILCRRIQRNVELAIGGDLATRGVERDVLARLALEEPVAVAVDVAQSGY